MSNGITLDSELIIFTTDTIDKFFKIKRGGDAFLLYSFYHLTCKKQKTNQPRCTNSFAMRGTGFGEDRFSRAIKILKELNLVEHVISKEESGKFGKTYIKLNYIRNQNQLPLPPISQIVDEESPLPPISVPAVESPSGKRGVQNAGSYLSLNAGSSINKNALSGDFNSSQNLSTAIESDFLGIESLSETPPLKLSQTKIPFEDFWNLYNKKENSKECKTKWEMISDDDRRIIMEKLPAYIESTPDVKYRKLPKTYLDQEIWRDEGFSTGKPKRKMTFKELDKYWEDFGGGKFRKEFGKFMTLRMEHTYMRGVNIVDIPDEEAFEALCNIRHYDEDERGKAREGYENYIKNEEPKLYI